MSGGSNAPGSLLVWTRPNLGAITLHDRFVPRGAAGLVTPEAAVSVGAGAIWLEAYGAVTTRGGRYVQGGGCTTVGVAGLVLGGGFGSFSKGFGTAAANLLEAEVVTADGAVRTANPVRHRELFWALKGGGGGSFGVATRLTLRTHALPAFFGAVLATVTAASDQAYGRLAGQVLWFYHQRLLNRHWGDVIRFGPGRQVAVTMTFQGLTRAQAERTWAPLFAWVTARPADYALTDRRVLAVPAREFWNAEVLEQVPGLIVRDDRPGAPEGNFYYAVDADQVGQVLHAYASTWLPRRLLEPDRRPALVAALTRASQLHPVALHTNKGLAGAPAEVLGRTRATAMNPAVLDAFALAIASANEPPAYPGIAGHQPDLAQGRADARVVAAAVAPLKALAGRPASSLSETDYFQPDWQAAFWGDHYARLSRVKDRYDPAGLFWVHHGVGTET
jgi:FAD/FMN-containing dehydrogenase